jgi:hypothetical protein
MAVVALALGGGGALASLETTAPDRRRNAGSVAEGEQVGYRAPGA